MQDQETMNDLDRRTAFYAEMFALQMGYLHQRLRREPWWGMDYGLGNFTMLKSVSKFSDGPRYDLDEIPWRKTLAACWEALQRAPADADREAFVAFLRSVFGERWMRAYPLFEDSLVHTHHYFGCFRYDYHDADRVVDLHFHNMEEPYSPLLSREKRQDDLRRIVRDVEAQHLQPVLVRFDTWMNNLKPVQALFPVSFLKTLTPAGEFPKGYGWWGQFITRDGGINRRRADMLLTKGRFEFARLAGECPWVEFQKFVEQN